MKAVVLAAGEGTRLEPLTNVRPKPMLPVANKPILEHVLEELVTAGIDDVVFVVGYKRRRIQDYFGDGSAWNADLTYVVQDTQLGSGHALLQAEPEVGSDVVVLNGDQLIDASAIEAVVEERDRTGTSVLAATRSAETELYGVVETADGTVVDIQEKPPGRAAQSELVNAGVYAFGPEVFAALRGTETDGELELTAMLRQHLDDHPVRAVPYEGPWFDVTWPWDLLTVNGHLIDREAAELPTNAAIHESAALVDDVACGENVSVKPNATVLRGTALGDNVTVGANAVVENSVVMADASIGAGSVVRDCIVGANATLGAGTVAEGGDTDLVIDETLHQGVRFGGIVGDNSSLGGDVTVTPGLLLGNEADVESGCRLRGRFEPGATIRRG